MTIGGLDRAHAARLIRSVAGVQPDAATLTALVDRTGGNPFYLAESARLLGSEGRLVATSKVPEGVRDVLRRRFARLPEITVSVLRLAAVIGREVDIDVLVRAAEVDEDTVLDALEAGVMAGLLTEPAHELRAVRARAGPRHPVRRRPPAAAKPLARQDRRRAGRDPAGRPGRAGPPLPPGRHGVDRPRCAWTPASGRPTRRLPGMPHDTAADLYAQALADLDRVPVDPRRSAGPGSGRRTGGTACATEPFATGSGCRSGREGQPASGPWRWPTRPAGWTC